MVHWHWCCAAFHQPCYSLAPWYVANPVSFIGQLGGIDIAKACSRNAEHPARQDHDFNTVPCMPHQQHGMALSSQLGNDIRSCTTPF